MAEFRNILAGGDLIRQRKGAAGWWLFGDKEKQWKPYRNLSREVRYLEERMHEAHAAYQAAREDYVVASTNVQHDKDLLGLHLLDNSEVWYELPSDESILSRRTGMKYNANNNHSQKQKGSGGGDGGNNNQKGGGNGGGNNQNQNQNQNGNQDGNKPQGQQKTKQRGNAIPMSKLLTAEVVLH